MKEHEDICVAVVEKYTRDGANTSLECCKFKAYIVYVAKNNFLTLSEFINDH